MRLDRVDQIQNELVDYIIKEITHKVSEGDGDNDMMPQERVYNEAVRLSRAVIANNENYDTEAFNVLSTYISDFFHHKQFEGVNTQEDLDAECVVRQLINKTKPSTLSKAYNFFMDSGTQLINKITEQPLSSSLLAVGGGVASFIIYNKTQNPN